MDVRGMVDTVKERKSDSHILVNSLERHIEPVRAVLYGSHGRFSKMW